MRDIGSPHTPTFSLFNVLREVEEILSGREEQKMERKEGKPKRSGEGGRENSKKKKKERYKKRRKHKREFLRGRGEEQDKKKKETEERRLEGRERNEKFKK